MSDILSQSEIEALLNTLAAEGESSPSSGKTHTKPYSSRQSNSKHEPYDFRRSDKLTKEQLKTLQVFHETFARLAGTNLSAYLRSPITIELCSVEQITYEEYLNRIDQSIFIIFSMPPLSNQSVFEMDFVTVFTIIDKLLGGPGKSVVRNVLTEIEEPLVKQIGNQFLKNLKGAWESILNLNVAIDEVKSGTQFVQIVPASDIVLAILFEIHIGETKGSMSICVPYTTLKPIANKLSAQKWTTNKSKNRNTLHQSLMTTHLSQLKLDCQVQLGTTHLNIKDFLNLQVGDILDLHQHSHIPLSFTIDNIPKFEGQPGSSGKKLAFHITKRTE